VARFRHSVTLPRPPEAVFPWLFEQGRVPQWTGNLEAYEAPAAVEQGSHVRQVLNISGQRVDLDLEITRYDPPRGAESRFAFTGVDVVIGYSLAPNGSGTELTQTLEANASGFKAKMLVPMVQPRLEKKLTEDLDKLREVLS
jgi:uncharacterized protein YndB with AHSA1/START domain